MKPLRDPESLFARIAPGSTVVLHSGFAEPPRLARMLAEQAASTRGLHLLTLMPMGEAPYGAAASAAALDVATFFPGSGLREALNARRVRALRYPLSRIPGLFSNAVIQADVALLQVSAPDETGQVSLGLSVDYMRAVLAQSPLLIAEVNPRLPYTYGDTRLHVDQIDWFLEGSEGPQQFASVAPDPIDQDIARHIAALIEDGAVLQLGIGSLPDQVLSQLHHLKHLGLHSGIVTDAVRPLLEAGVIDNSRKKRFAGVSVATMAGGTQAFYDFLHNNRAIEFHPCSVTHAAETLADLDGLCAINAALQVDLLGNVNAESVGGRAISLPGGLPDFAWAASRVRRGMSIIALRSSFGKSATSNIVVQLEKGVPHTVPGDAVDFVVTEYGVASLRGQSASGRAAAIAAIAHPQHRSSLQHQFAQSESTETPR